MQTPSYGYRAAHWRLSGYYVAFFSVYAITIPLWPRWLEGQLPLEFVGVVLGGAYWGKLLFVPATSWIADRIGRRRPLLVALALILLGGVLLLPLFDHWIFYALIWGIAGAALSSGVPLSDGLTMRASQLLGIEFGKTRKWGSISFIVATLLVGFCVDRFGLDAIYVALVVTSCQLVGAAFWVPGLQTRPNKAGVPFFKPLVLPNFPLFVLTVSLLMSSHAALYGFSAIHWKALGYSNTTITLLWVLGVVAEICMFNLSGRLIGRFGAMPMISLAALGGVVRWTLLAWGTSLPVLGLAQLLHAFTFALLYMALIGYMTKRVPPDISASAQGLYDSLSMGIFFGFLTMLAGYLFGIDPAYSFLLMTGCSVIGFGLSLVLLVRVRRFEREQSPVSAPS
ncbi:MFS transporter [Sneathiella chinensis]|uniref:MFS transporter n=1 Tax=Sneathiella chinensis TaxID=349750 RepID=A0ABQ5U9B7_9PROT|nr:MFS transporter [Sneathiella chinensis]GLQ07902.1 MFS transporter [Sneathiella chinensis]